MGFIFFIRKMKHVLVLETPKKQTIFLEWVFKIHINNNTLHLYSTFQDKHHNFTIKHKEKTHKCKNRISKKQFKNIFI